MLCLSSAFRGLLQSGLATWFDAAIVGSNQRCLANETAEPWRCFFAQYLAGYIQTPMFVVNRCDTVTACQLYHVSCSVHSMYDPANYGFVLRLHCGNNLTLCNATELHEAQAYYDLYLSVLQRDLLSRGNDVGLYATACNQHAHTCRQLDYEVMQVRHIAWRTLPGSNLMSVRAGARLKPEPRPCAVVPRGCAPAWRLHHQRPH